jgi:UDP-N-acetylmuramoyl-L-alanyl-D-glutamate--2,6-diaminopimelate ligase
VRLGTLLAAARLEAAVTTAWGSGAVAGLPGGDTRFLEPEIAGPEIADIVIVSSQVGPGALFGCVPGEHADGHDYAGEAVGRGAVALLCERPLDLPVPQVLVPSVRRALGPVSAALWAYPAKAMRVVGVTGTNGKTTTCALLASIFEANGWPAGVIGTLTGERTTPEAPVLQRRLAEMRDGARAAVSMEVSSHALDQHRVDGTNFSAGVFTNLSQDHLDYHVTMDAYFASKARLFTSDLVGIAVVNRHGPWGARLVELVSGRGADLVTYAPEDANDVVIGPSSSSFSWRGRRLELRMTGRFNILNALAAATTAAELGVGLDAISAGLGSAAPVRGRFEPVEAGQPFTVLVDYAHTPAALAETLMAARELTGRRGEPDEGKGRVLLVFGAGGDRDRTKRPLMGKVACELADVAVITSDNPRSEPPRAIIEEVASGANGKPYLVEVDRAKAITRTLDMAAGGDVVLIAGKGHETGQDFGTHVEPFDDVQVARRALVGRGRSGPSEGLGQGDMRPRDMRPRDMGPANERPEDVRPAGGPGGRGHQN